MYAYVIKSAKPGHVGTSLRTTKFNNNYIALCESLRKLNWLVQATECKYSTYVLTNGLFCVMDVVRATQSHNVM